MRTNNSIRNIIAALTSNIFTIIIGLIAQAIFIKTLGHEYLGLNGLFANLVSMLSIAELGLGSAIIYNLYKPISTNNHETIKSLMDLYKKSYRKIALVILVIGLAVIPFLPNIVGKNGITENINIFYLLFLFDVVVSYFLSYKRSILIAHQKNYLINIIHIIYLLVLNGIQIAVLLITKNYYIFLIMKIVMRILENVVISTLVNKKYSYLKDKDVSPLDGNILSDIITKIKSLFIHKIAGFIVLGTDNILISKLFGLGTVGLYSNYYLIIGSINVLITQTFSSVTSSIGELLINSDIKKRFEVYKNIRFINVWISIFAGTSLLVIMDNFILVWIGQKYILSEYILIALVVNYYFQSVRSVNLTFKEAAGIFYEDRFVPIVESILNIILSLIFANMFGLIGIFMGTICSNLLLHLYSYPKYVYKKLFNRSYKQYIIENTKYFIMFIICASVTYTTSRLMIGGKTFNDLILNMLMCIFIPNILLALVYRSTEEYKYYKKLLKTMLSKKNTNLTNQ